MQRKHYCERCGQYFCDKDRMNDHLKSKRHKIKCGELEKPKTDCELCNFQGINSAHYKRHIQSQKHISNMQQQIVPHDEGDETFCSTCFSNIEINNASEPQIQ